MLLTMTTTLPDLATLSDTARRLTTRGRGILAADESISTMSTRLDNEGIPPSVTTRRDYRELLLAAAGLSEWVSGVIWCDETFGQSLSDDRPFPQAARELGILPGIKVDTGTKALPGRDGALVTEGLDGLGDRLASYADRGAAFAKWRAVFDVATITPYSARVNGHALARYAALMPGAWHRPDRRARGALHRRPFAGRVRAGPRAWHCMPSSRSSRRPESTCPASCSSRTS